MKGAQSQESTSKGSERGNSERLLEGKRKNRPIRVLWEGVALTQTNPSNIQ